MTADRAIAPPFRALARAAAAIAYAAAVGVAAGVLTVYSQGSDLNRSFSALADSGAIWTLVAFAVSFIARPIGVAALAGTSALAGEVFGYYYDIIHVRHWSALQSEIDMWVLAAMLIGPLAGIGAHFVRFGTPSRRLTAWLAVCGMIAGEGAHELGVIGATSWGWWKVIAGCFGAVVAVALERVPVSVRIAALGGGSLVAIAVYLAYAAPHTTRF